jgi:hypothetical protein
MAVVAILGSAAYTTTLGGGGDSGINLLRDNSVAHVQAAKYQLVGMEVMKAVKAEGLARLEELLRKMRPWTPPRVVPPPNMPAFEDRLVVDIRVASRVVRIEMTVTPGREFILDEGRKRIYEVAADQQEELRRLLAVPTRQRGSP